LDPLASVEGVPGLIAVFAAGLLAASLRAPARGLVASAAAVLLAAPSLAAGLGYESPRAWPRPTARETSAIPGEEVAADDLVPLAWRAGAEAPALRIGALARTPPASSWPGSPPPLARGTWMPVPEGAAATIPVDRTGVRVFGEG